MLNPAEENSVIYFASVIIAWALWVVAVQNLNHLLSFKNDYFGAGFALRSALFTKKLLESLRSEVKSRMPVLKMSKYGRSPGSASLKSCQVNLIKAFAGIFF